MNKPAGSRPRTSARKTAIGKHESATPKMSVVSRRTIRDRLEAALVCIGDPAGEGARACLTVYAASARLEADAADARAKSGLSLGPLDGTIVSVKDLFDVAGEPTCAGSTVLAHAPPADQDAPVVRRLRAAGAVILAKTNMTEFAFSGVGLNPHYGTPGNPADRGRIPGGSSSGAAVAVADAMCEIGIGTDTGGSTRIPAALCGIIGFKPSQWRVPREGAPCVASFHFGLPATLLLDRVKQAGCVVFSSATTAAEARWLVERGADVIIAQGYEAGGHRGMFLTEDLAAQFGTFALVPQVADAVDVPVIAAGGITDARGIAAAFALGACGVQTGTAFLFCPEAKISALHRATIKAARDDGTALTNLMTGRPARGFYNRLMRELGPISNVPPEFPLASAGVAPLRAKAEAQCSADFSPLWSGQAASLGCEMPAGELLAKLSAEAQQQFGRLAAG